MVKINTEERKGLNKRQELITKKALVLHELVTGLTTTEAVAMIEMEKAWLFEKAMEKLRDFK